ncbi:MAG: TetR/AcrR family transcriptional regulator [Rhodomicrobium sp.]
MNQDQAKAKMVTSTSAKEKPVIRAGRPRRELAGEVETRILDAAHRVFLKRGLAGASIDEIARLAPASKPTVYARFPNKEELFTAVLSRKGGAYVALFESDMAGGATVDERLIRLGTAILHGALVEDTAGLVRLAIAEAQRFPDLADSIERMVRDRSADALGRLFAELAQSGELAASPHFAPERRTESARFFLDLILLPLLIRALFGEKLEVLHAEIGPHVEKSVSFFLRACVERSG